MHAEAKSEMLPLDLCSQIVVYGKWGRGQESCIYGQDSTGYPARFITGEEKRSPCDIPSCAFCSQWTGSAAQRAHIIVYMADECPVDMSGCETIDTDIVASVMDSHDTCELRYTGFCDRVGNIGGEAGS